MNLIVDQGNTATKFAFFSADGKLVERKTVSKEDLDTAQRWILEEGHRANHVLVSSVTNQQFSFPQKDVLYLDLNTPIPLKNSYESPQTLGRDRLANAVAIWMENPNKNSLCIDLGTCIKYDLVNNEGCYLGGNISPGMQMRYQALAHFTDQLPLIEPGNTKLNYGTTTETSIRNGVQQAVFHEINGFIQRYDEQFAELTIFMTGGDLKYFDKGFKNTIFADSDLTMKGLNEILKYNVEA